ncbi:MAG: tetratricopeptide repeat protein [Deltaproteobacteria bacterium]|nr:MAG: tetratricopeptide repeat protein [Deltaproteobacteria bacterium]
MTKSYPLSFRFPILLLLLFSPPLAFGEEQGAWEEAETHFLLHEYDAAIPLYLQALDEVSDDAERIEIFKRLGICYTLEHDEKNASAVFREILKLDPAAAYDPLYASPEVITAFEVERMRWQREWEEAREGEPVEPDDGIPAMSAESEAASPDTPSIDSGIPSVSDLPTAGGGTSVSLGVRLLPFGIGHFAVGERRKGTFFLAGETLLFGTNIATYFARVSLRNGDGRYPEEDVGKAKALQTVQLATGVAALALLLWDVADGLSPPPLPSRSAAFFPRGVPVLSLGKDHVFLGWQTWRF